MQFFRVDPAAVRRLGAAFQSASGTVRTDAAAFATSARLRGGVLGRLPGPSHFGGHPGELGGGGSGWRQQGGGGRGVEGGLEREVEGNGAESWEGEASQAFAGNWRSLADKLRELAADYDRMADGLE